ncbi:MAG: NUDIX domain-containing protein, partial [Gammaproteobacteria bacterium]|nr:NUDIX domain-containing protein [Gammaproteobacteria bacterium]
AREVFEETGLKIANASHAGYSDEMLAMAGRHYLTLYVTAACLPGEPVVMEPEKCRCWQWFPYDDLPEPLFQPIHNLMKQVPDLSKLQIHPDIREGVQK